ncbi:MAG: hypothetical protein K5622_00375 [Endomicrobiaceae bacterium]|nr:hypothetical protein [Endomicrobiaceae bacterium]
MIDLRLKEELKKYLEQHYVQPDIEDLKEFEEEQKHLSFEEDLTLNDFVKKHLKNFNDILRNYIKSYNKKNKTKDSDIYKKANIPKEHFNKIINQKIKPQKKPLMALGIALDLTQKEIEKLLNAAGFTFTNTSRFDVIVTFCLEKNIKDIMTINEFLYESGEECFGSFK